MRAVLQIAAGVAAGTGLLALAGANLGRHAESLPEPTGPAVVQPAAAGHQVPAPEPAAWRTQALRPDEVPAGVLARVARRVAESAPGCPPVAPVGAGNAATRGTSAAPAAAAGACKPGNEIESVEIDWHAPTPAP
jgi:hypothetical protein